MSFMLNELVTIFAVYQQKLNIHNCKLTTNYIVK
jgi:hypothetical protein